MTSRWIRARTGQTVFPAPRLGSSAANVTACALVAVGLATVAPLRAQNAQNGATPPAPLEHVAPEAPQTAVGTALEGWVTLRYTVLADGSTADVRVIDSMPPELDPRDTVEAVESWKFTPAMAGGEPIPWYNNESVIVFDDPEITLEPTPMFAAGYREVVNLIDAGEFEDAKQRNERLTLSRLGEIGVAQAQLAYIDASLEEPYAAYTAILRATDPAVPALTPVELSDALRYRFVIEAGLGRVADALDTYQRRQELGIGGEDPLAAQAEFIEQALAGDMPIGVKGRVGREPWMHRPSRRTFTFGNVDGDVREIRVECDRRVAVLEYMPDVDWTLPDSWGSCVLFVDAKRDTTFLLYEFK